MTPRESAARYIVFVALAAGVLVAAFSCREEQQPTSIVIPVIAAGSVAADASAQQDDLAFAQSRGLHSLARVKPEDPKAIQPPASRVMSRIHIPCMRAA